MANTGNTQQQIDYGAAANDGTGDPLRTAFIKTDDNFDAIWNTGPVGSNITIVNNTIQSNNTNGSIVLRPNGVGAIQANAAILPNATNLRDLGTADLRFRAAYIGTGGLSVDGNVTVTGNLTAGNISYTGNVFVGDLQGSVFADDSTIMVDAIDNEMFASAATFGQVDVSGNITANYFIGNGSLLTDIAGNYSDANVADFLANNFGSNTISTFGNISAGAVRTGAIVNDSPINITTSNFTWQFAGDILRGPEGGSWQSASDTIYLTSPANGYITLESQLNGNTVSELFMEHSFIRFFIDNGIDATWQMLADGRTEFPSYIFPYADGNIGEVLKTDGSGNLAWAADSSDYGNANVADYLVSDFGTFGSNTIVTAGNVVASVVDTGAIVNDFTIGIQGGEYLWQFAGNILRSPEGGTWQSASGTEYISSNATSGFIQFTAYDAGNLATELFMEHGFVRIRVDNGGPEQDWNFRLSGTLDVPGDIIPQSNGTASLGNATNYWSNLWVANNTIYIGGVPLGVTGNTLTVNGESVTGNITFTDTTMSPPDGVDITISAANSEVIIEALDIRLDATDDLRLTGNDIVSLRNRSTTDPVTIITDYDNTETTWTFAVDGTLTAPGDIVVAGDITGTAGASTLVLKAQPASNTAIQLNDSVDSVISTVADLEIRTDVSNTAKTFEFGADGRLILPESSEANVAKLTSPPNDANVSLQLYSGNAVRIVSNTVAGSYDWTFVNDGNLLLPGNTFAVKYANGTAVSLGGNYGDSNVVSLLGTFGSNNITTTGNITANNFIGNVSLTGNVQGTSANVTLVAGSYSTVFDNTGTATFPGNIVGNTAGFAIGYRDIPQVSFTGDATLAATAAGKHYYSTLATGNTLTIANNTSVSWSVGTAITVVNRGTGNITVAQGSGVSLYLAGNSTAGNRTVTTYGMATLLNVAANVWMINGTGVV